MIEPILSILYRICLTLSLFYALYDLKQNGLKRQHAVSIYLMIIFLTELIVLIFKWQHLNHAKVYNVTMPLFITSLAVFYAFEWKRKIHMSIHWMITAIATIVMIVMINAKGLITFNIPVGIILASYYIFCSLHWFLYQISFPDEKNITSKMTFWISIGLLFWSIIFIFRAVLMFYLYQTDKLFLSFFQIALTTSNIIVYLLFMKGIACKR